MTSTFRGAVAALAAAACIAPGSASASVELQDYVFSSSVNLSQFDGVENLHGAFTLDYDNTSDHYDLNSIDFRFFNHVFTTTNTSVSADVGNIQLSGYDGDSHNFAQFTLSFVKSPVLFSDIEVAVSACFDGSQTCSGQDTSSSIGTIKRLGAAVPEPATWALMIGGFSLAGATLRRRRAAIAAA